MRNNMQQTPTLPPRKHARVHPCLRLLQPKLCVLPALIFLLLLFSGACAGLQQVFPQPVLRNPSFEDYCTNGTGFFFAPNTSQHADSGLQNISSSMIKWNITGSGLEVKRGGASDGDCYLDPFWRQEAGGVNQTLTTAPDASYLVRFDMMIYQVATCANFFSGMVYLQVSAGEQNATTFTGSAEEPWSPRLYQFQASSYQTELSIGASSACTCGVAVDNVRVELVREPSSNVLVNGGFESGSGISEDPGSTGSVLLAGSQKLSSWVATKHGVTCFGASFFPPTEGRRLVWLGTQDGFTQYPGGLQQRVATEPNVTYHISFDSACQCRSNGSAVLFFCKLQVDVGSESLNFTILAQNHTAENPGWSRTVVEFVATSNQTTVGFQDAAPSQTVFGVSINQCAPYLDNVVMSIPAQQALLRLKNGLGSPSSLWSWNGLPDPCLIPAANDTAWVGVSCLGVDVIGLDLSASGLSGSIPIELLPFYSSLQSLNLSSNLLSGSIPSFLKNMQKLVTLDLSNNSLQGGIPAELGNLTLLEELDLQGNQLDGEIPSTLALPSLKVLNLQMNSLSGSVPQGISLLRDGGTILTFTPGNKDLCSESTKDLLKSCNQTATASQSSKKKTSLPGALGSSAAAIVVLGIILLTALRVRHAKRSKANRKVDLKLDTCQAFSLQELEEATWGFAVMLGKGGYGMVYEAKLKDGRVAAVKRLNQVSRQGPQEFISEVELLSRLHHANLVSLLGYCIENREHILVYEFMPKGSLYEILHNPASQHHLAWGDRMKIALHIAFGIEYLHYFANPGLVHRDIKSANILLDEKNTAKVADFGLCKEAPLGIEGTEMTAIKGSFGYLDPAYVKTNRLSRKSDVFSYGVILLELITGRKAFTEGELLTDWCKQFEQLHVSLMVDPMLGRNYPEEELIMIVGVARDCLIEQRALRPNMRSVVHRLCEGLPLLLQEALHSADTPKEIVELGDNLSVLGDESSVLYPR